MSGGFHLIFCHWAAVVKSEQVLLASFHRSVCGTPILGAKNGAERSAPQCGRKIRAASVPPRGDRRACHDQSYRGNAAGQGRTWAESLMARGAPIRGAGQTPTPNLRLSAVHRSGETGCERDEWSSGGNREREFSGRRQVDGWKTMHAPHGDGLPAQPPYSAGCAPAMRITSA